MTHLFLIPLLFCTSTEKKNIFCVEQSKRGSSQLNIIHETKVIVVMFPTKFDALDEFGRDIFLLYRRLLHFPLWGEHAHNNINKKFALPCLPGGGGGGC